MQMRTTKPEAGNKYYNTTSAGGWSQCIVGSPTDAGANVLSNCVGYACGRFNEIIGSMKYPALNCNAENFIERAQSLGLEITQEPSVGAIMVWQKGTLSSSDGAGHVAIVERVDSDSQVYTSESNYAGTAFYNSIRKKVNGAWYAWSGYTFRGFIKNPAVKDDVEPEPGTDEITIGSQVAFKGGRVYASSTATQPASNRPSSTCKVTALGKSTAPHPVHLQSVDGRGVYGWVDKADISLPTAVKLYNTTIFSANAGDTKTIADLAKQLELEYKTDEVN